MKSNAKIFGYLGYAMAGLVLCAGSVAHALGLIINTTPSLPIGLWQSTTSTILQAGDVVTFCPAETPPFRLAHQRLYIASGACPSGLVMLMKPIAALPGDEVQVSDDGIAVNGRIIPNSIALKHDDEGRALQGVASGQYIVAPGQVWLISSFNPRSFDSRYFGPVPIVSFISAARPLLVDRAP